MHSDDVALAESTAYTYGLLRGNLSAFGALRPGWHAGRPDSVPTSRESIDAAAAVLDSLMTRSIMLPLVHPTPEGGVILGWDLGTVTISVELDRAGARADLKARRATDGAERKLALPAAHVEDITSRVRSTIAKA